MNNKTIKKRKKNIETNKKNSHFSDTKTVKMRKGHTLKGTLTVIIYPLEKIEYVVVLRSVVQSS
jgi:hypothetical protein